MPADPCPPVTHPGPRPVMRAVWVGVGALALVLGAVGVVLPVLPTTPFVLLAAFAFARSAPRLRAWLTGSRIFGPVIADWEAHGAIPPRAKAMACCAMAAVLAASLIGGVGWKILLVQVICLGCAASYVLSRPSGSRPRDRF